MHLLITHIYSLENGSIKEKYPERKHIIEQVPMPGSVYLGISEKYYFEKLTHQGRIISYKQIEQQNIHQFTKHFLINYLLLSHTNI